MMLVHSDFEKQIILNNSRVTEWIIESPELFSQYLLELSSQIAGGDGKFVLLNNDKELSFSKSVTIISNPLDVSLNDKKIVSKIYNELQQVAVNEEYYVKTKEIIACLQQYLLDLEYNNDFSLHINEDIDIQGLFKLFEIRIEEDELNFTERLFQFIRIQNVVMRQKLIILVNIRSYFTEQQLEELFLFAKYNEICLLMIESFQRDFTNSTYKYIIDIDKCEI